MKIIPTQADIGRSVIYLSRTDRAEEGVITSFTTEWIFVRYKGDHHSKATRPEDLIWTHSEIKK